MFILVVRQFGPRLSSCLSSIWCDSPAVTAHHLHDECALMRIRRTNDGIDGLDDAMQRRVRADGHVRAAKIVVDRADHAGDVQHAVLFALLVVDPFVVEQFVQQTAPLLTEQICAG